MKIKIIIYALLLGLAITTSISAKRLPASEVEPVIHENIKYIAPNDDGRREYIQAWDTKTKKKLWELTIYENPIQSPLEEDVQWVFIKALKMEKGNLLVADERGRQYLVDLTTKRFKRLK